VPASKPPKLDTIDNLLKAMLVFSRTVDNVLESRAVEGAVGQPLSSSKVQILRLLGQRGGQTASRVARYLGVSNPAVSQIIDSMVADKLVIRETGLHDRREVNLRLTERGRQFFHAMRRQQRHLLRNAIRSASSPAVDRWIKTLLDAAGSMAQADQAFERFCLQCGAHADGTCVLVGGDAECVFLQQPGRKAGGTGRRRTAPVRRTTKKTARRKAVRARS